MREENAGDKRRTRRHIIQAGVASAAGAVIAAPYIRNAEAATTTTWKIQTSWPAGIGLNTFKTWCNGIKEKTGGELEFKPFAAKEVVGDFELLDGVKNGVLEAMNSFCVYWVGKIPATAFLSSYLMGLRYPHEWDIFFYGKNGVQMAREIYAKQGLFWVGRVHHGPNIVHSKKPIRSIEDFKDLKLRVPGGMIAEGFAAAGARTTLLPGGEVFSALEKGTVDAADYTGPAVNWDLGFQQVTKYIWLGPPGTRVDLSAGRPHGHRREHERLEQVVARNEAVGRKRGGILFRGSLRCDPESGYGDLAEVRKSRIPDQSHALGRP